MTTHELPDEPVFAFAPAYELPDQPQQIRIVFEGMDGYIPTALVALTLADAERLCDRLNRRLGLDREAMEQAGRAVHGHRPGRRAAALGVFSVRRMDQCCASEAGECHPRYRQPLVAARRHRRRFNAGICQRSAPRLHVSQSGPKP